MKKRRILFCGVLAACFIAEPSLWAKGQAVPGKYLVRLKSDNASQLPFESVGRLLGGIVKGRSAYDPRVVIIEKDQTLASQKVIEEFLKNPMVESAKPYFISESRPESGETFLGL